MKGKEPETSVDRILTWLGTEEGTAAGHRGGSHICAVVRQLDQTSDGPGPKVPSAEYDVASSVTHLKRYLKNIFNPVFFVFTGRAIQEI